MKQPRGIQSIEVGSRLLVALVHLGRPAALKDLAQAAHMTPAKAHPYLVSFGKVGLVAQHAESGRYGLGPLALQAGLISLQQADPVRMAGAELPALARAVGHTVGIAIWGNRGPTFVRLEEGPHAVHVNMRHGTVVSVRGTAAGRLFAAHLPKDQLRAALKAEGARADAAFQAELAAIRARGWAAVDGGTVAGIAAVAAPVFGAGGALALALTAIGPSATLPTDAGASPAQALLAGAAALSQRLGARLG